MKSAVITLVVNFAFLTSLFGRSADWLDRRMNDLIVAEKIENREDKIAALGKFMSIGSHGGMDADQKVVYGKAQTALLSVPGHAKYYQDKIEAMRAEVLVNFKKSEAEISKMQVEGLEVFNDSHYESFCVNAFRVLAHLPSPESVAVLGFYLNDPVGRDGKTLLGGPRKMPGDDFGPRPINSEGAAIAIRKLGIEHPPFPPYEDQGMWYVRDGEVDAWKNWWNDVKEGRRTYRFKGSSIEYGADGPASREVIERAAMDRKRDEERRTGKRHTNLGSEPDAPTRTTSKPSGLAGIIAACALISGAIWYFLRGRKAA